MDGFLILDKPLGLSSAAALNRVKRSLPRGVKLGHAGTLDPLATGVLVALVGRATKLCERVMALPKSYDATVKLGATTDTLDAGSPEVAAWSGEAPPRAALEAALAKMVGDVEQTPPAYSALKVGGRRAYDLARGGQAVELKPRVVRIARLELGAYAWPFAELAVDCGRGTYVRSLARDLGDALEVGGYLARLVRTRVGPFDLARAATLEVLEHDGVEPHLLPPDTLPA